RGSPRVLAPMDDPFSALSANGIRRSVDGVQVSAVCGRTRVRTVYEKAKHLTKAFLQKRSSGGRPMSRRLGISLGVLAIVLVGVSILGVRGQLAWAGLAGKTADAEAWTSPKTAWGDPDLQGIYNYGTSTPLQRPKQVGDKQVLSDDEATQLQSNLAYRLDRDRRDGGAQADVSRSYNDAWMDPNRKQLTADKRTSLIVDPPDGRIPARVERKLT